MSAIIAWCLANQALIATVKANGLISLILLQVQAQLKSKGAKEI